MSMERKQNANSTATEAIKSNIKTTFWEEKLL